MGEEVKISDYEATANGGSDGGDDETVHEWEMGLPTGEDLTPLSQLLIPQELASAFSISPEPHRTLLDVNRASQSTFSNIRSGSGQLSSNNFKPFSDDPTQEPTIVEADGSGSESRKSRKVVMDSEEADSAIRTAENSVDYQSGTRTTVKRPRLVWTPQLHKRFVDVVSHLGIKNAVPKTIMQLMNVEGLTRENVASHLQKYRLYLKRMQGLSSEGPSSSDLLFASTPLPQKNGNAVANGGNGHVGMPVAVQYHGGQGGMMAMHHPVYGMGSQGGQAVMHHGGGGYGMVQGREWSGSNYGYHSHHHHHHHHHHPHHVAPNDNL